MKKYKLVCFCQIYNELEKDNLVRFFKYVKPLVDELVVYDDCSTDGSYEYAKKQTEHVIRGTKNDFVNEISHKQLLLNEALKLSPDFILWLDADEVLTANATCTRLNDLCEYCIENDLDGLSLHELNLWRSHSWRRIDSLYDDGWFIRLWRVQSGIDFGEPASGLHTRVVPPAIRKIEKLDDIAVIHYGFSSKKQLAYKYLVYRLHGQRGYDMLDRLISEEKLVIEKVPKELFPEGLWVDDEKPGNIPFTESLSYVEAYKDQVFRPKYSIACLIYKSVDWLQYVYEQVLKFTDLRDVEFYFVTNDADEAVLKYLRDNYIPHYEFNNTPEHRKEWYINNVYRAYNYAAKVAKGDFLVFVNSDMGFTPGWLDALIAAYNGENLIASRLVESGKLKSGAHGIEKDFGYIISEYRENNFLTYAETIKEDKVSDSGLFMPLLVNKRHFKEIGGYPEGNIKKGSDIFKVEIAKPEDPQISGDNVLMQRMATIGLKHQTAMSSVAYHFQCGEKDEQEVSVFSNKKIEIAVCNDICGGTMGERVLWNYFLEILPGAYPVDKKLVGESNFEGRAKQYITNEHPNTKIVIQNATFIRTIDSSLHTVAFLQDDLRLMGRQSSHQEANLRLASTIVTNSVQTALSYPEYNFEIIPVGVDSDLFSPKDKKVLRKKYGFGEERIGIFVGSFSEVKGWSKVAQCIEKYPDINWIVVSKYDEKYEAPNARVFTRIDQNKLSELLNCADFFIIGSPVETQCLAAVEANLCNLPVVMPIVGIYRDFTPAERTRVGVFGDNLEKGVKDVVKIKLNPRDLIIEKKLTVHASMKKWHTLLEKIVQRVNSQELTKTDGREAKKSRLTYHKYQAEFLIRKHIFLRIFGRKFLNINEWLSVASVKKIIYRILVELHLLSFVKRILRMGRL